MNGRVNREVIAKLVMHRLIARALARDRSLEDKARASLQEMAARYPDQDFVRDWEHLLRLPAGRIRRTPAAPDQARRHRRGLQ
jgi:hypothetical protein